MGQFGHRDLLEVSDCLAEENTAIRIASNVDMV
jgi:hypothetical protein